MKSRTFFHNPLVLLIGFLTLVGVAAASYNTIDERYASRIEYTTQLLAVGSGVVQADIADTFEKRVRGLSGRPTLAPTGAMLFVFNEDDRHSIWMKDMRFSIDILWLDSAYRVVDIKQEATPDSYPEIFRPSTSARYVLELPAGSVERFGVGVGDSIQPLE
jgi:uncharacterized membrane protein (UPF0127 family)